MSFEGDTLYSYGTPIAKIYRRNKRVLVLTSEHGYSASTSRQLSLARRAVSHLAELAVPRYIVGGSGGRYRGGRNAAEDHAANLAFFVTRAAEDLASAQRAFCQRRELARG